MSNNITNGFPLMGETSNQLAPVGLPWIGGKKEKFKVYSSFFPKNIQTLVDPFTGGRSHSVHQRIKSYRMILTEILLTCTKSFEKMRIGKQFLIIKGGKRISKKLIKL